MAHLYWYMVRMQLRMRRIAAAGLFLLAALNAATFEIKAISGNGNTLVRTMISQVHPLISFLGWMQFVYPAVLALMLARGTSITRCLALTIAIICGLMVVLIWTATDEVSLAMMRGHW